MVCKPSFWDSQYSDKNKSFEENLGNYKRDMMLWEQTEAIKKMQNNNSSGQTTSDTYTLNNRTSNTIRTLYSDYLNKTNNNKFEEGSEQSIKYNRILNKYKTTLERADHLEYQFTALLYLVLICILALGFPTVFIVNNDLVKILVFTLLPLNILAFIINKVVIKHTLDKAYELKENAEKFVYNNKQELKSYIPPVKIYVRKRNKPKEIKEKTILYLEHNK